MATPDDDRFQKLAGEYIEQYLQTYPSRRPGSAIIASMIG